MPAADTVVILDFETTGLSPGMGDRAIEIGAVRIDNGQVTERFQELMNPGQRISGFIELYTGITNSPAPCLQPGVFINMHPTINWAPWWRIRNFLWRALSTGPCMILK
jgi:hypothetical protein